MSAPKPATPSETLVAILITFLTPLFLGGVTGNHDIAAARSAAVETVNSFRIRNAWDLFKVVQIIAFGIAALGSLDLSMDDGMSVSMVLRCRANANALQRSSDRAQSRLDNAHAQAAADLPPLDEAAVREAFRQAAEAQQAVADARLRARDEAREPELTPGMIALRDALDAAAAARDPACAATLAAIRAERAAEAAGGRDASAAAISAERDQQIQFAEAMATVAAELAQEMPHMPPGEQRKHTARIAALAEVSQQLSRGEAVETSYMAGFRLPDTTPPARRPVT